MILFCKAHCSLSVFACFAACLLASRVSAAPPETIIHPAAAPGPLDNPLKGWCPYTDANPISLPYSMVFLYVPWSELEPESGKYAFDAWEQRAWTVESAKGKHVVFRVYADSPTHPSGFPKWLRDDGVRLTRYSDHGGGESPDYDDPRVVAALERLIAALGKRYDEHPRVAFVQLGLLGFWGEWHTYPRDELFASSATQQKSSTPTTRPSPTRS